VYSAKIGTAFAAGIRKMTFPSSAAGISVTGGKLADLSAPPE
jgi:hypothetical protein